MRTKKENISWGKKLHAINRSFMSSEPSIKICLKTQHIKATTPITLKGYVKGIMATYPKRSGGGFYNATGTFYSKAINLIIFPANMSSDYSEYVKNMPQWWHLAIFIILSIGYPFLGLVLIEIIWLNR